MDILRTTGLFCERCSLETLRTTCLVFERYSLETLRTTRLVCQRYSFQDYTLSVERYSLERNTRLVYAKYNVKRIQSFVRDRYSEVETTCLEC